MNASYTIDYETLPVGVHDFEFIIDDSLFELWEESEVKSGVGTAKIHVVKHADVAELSAKLSGEVKVPCDRCLEEFMLPFEWEGDVVIKVGCPVNEDEDDGETIFVDPADQNLDLSQWLYESVILSLPFSRVHPNISDCNQDMVKRFKIEE